jgi:hypothetical protein
MEGRYHALAKERIILLRYESLAAILGWWRRRQKTLERPAFIAHPVVCSRSAAAAKLAAAVIGPNVSLVG